MIRDGVIKWALIALLALFAFMLLPAYEYFTPNEPIASTLGVVPLSMKKGMGGEAPVCSWETKEGKAPKDKPTSYLTGTEYKVLEKAKIDCSMDSSCRGVLGRTKNGNLPNYYLMSTDTVESYTGSDKVAFHKKKEGCTKDPLDPPCEWSEPQKDMAPKNDTLNYFFPTLYTAQIGCADRDDCVGITKDDDTNFYYLSNEDKLHEKKGKTFYKKRKCSKHDDDGGGEGGGNGGSCSWPEPKTKRQIKGGQTALIPAPPFNSRSEAEKECAKKAECKGVARFGDWFGLSKTAETVDNDGPFDFTEKPSGCSQSDYSSGPSTSWPPVDDIMDGGSGKADKSDGTRAGAGYGPGAMYGNGKQSKPWFQGSEEDNYIAKSALVPCTCTTHSMGCAKHAGGRESSKAPGDMDGGGDGGYGGSPNQYGIMKPFSKAFENQEEPSGFLNAFNAFMK